MKNFSKLMPFLFALTLISLPKLDKEDAQELMSARGIDSVLLKLERELRGVKIPIGYLKVDMGPKGIVADSILFFVDYYAAGTRSSHTRYVCPPYNHDFVVSDLEIRNKMNNMKTMVVSPQFEARVKDGIPSRFLYNGQGFVGGKDILVSIS